MNVMALAPAIAWQLNECCGTGTDNSVASYNECCGSGTDNSVAT